MDAVGGNHKKYAVQFDHADERKAVSCAGIDILDHARAVGSAIGSPQFVAVGDVTGREKEGVAHLEESIRPRIGRAHIDVFEQVRLWRAHKVVRADIGSGQRHSVAVAGWLKHRVARRSQCFKDNGQG